MSLRTKPSSDEAILRQAQDDIEKIASSAGRLAMTHILCRNLPIQL